LYRWLHCGYLTMCKSLPRSNQELLVHRCVSLWTPFILAMFSLLGSKLRVSSGWVFLRPVTDLSNTDVNKWCLENFFDVFQRLGHPASGRVLIHSSRLVLCCDCLCRFCCQTGMHWMNVWGCPALSTKAVGCLLLDVMQHVSEDESPANTGFTNMAAVFNNGDHGPGPCFLPIQPLAATF